MTSGCAIGALVIAAIVFRSLRKALAGAEARPDRVLVSKADPADRSRRQPTSPEAPVSHAGTVIVMDTSSGAEVRDDGAFGDRRTAFSDPAA